MCIDEINANLIDIEAGYVQGTVTRGSESLSTAISDAMIESYTLLHKVKKLQSYKVTNL